MRISQNVLEEAARTRFLSPDGLCLDAGEARLLWHTRALPHFQRCGDEFQLVLWHAREERTIFEYALEILEEDTPSLARSLAYQRPPLVRRLPESPPARNGPPFGLLELGEERGLDVFGVFPGTDGIDLWCAEITGTSRSLCLCPPDGWGRVEMARLDGEDRRPVPVEAGTVVLPVPGWGLFRLGLRRG